MCLCAMQVYGLGSSFTFVPEGYVLETVLVASTVDATADTPDVNRHPDLVLGVGNERTSIPNGGVFNLETA